MRGDEKDEIAGIDVCGLVGRGSLKTRQFAESWQAADAPGLALCETADHEGRVSVVHRDIGDELLAVEDGDVVLGTAGQGLDLEIDVHLDGPGPLYNRGCLQGEAKIFELNLGDSEGTAGGCIEQAGSADLH